MSLPRKLENLLNNDLLKGSLITFALRIGGVLAGYLFAVYVTRTYNPTIFGQYSLYITILNLLTLFVIFGNDSLVLKKVASGKSSAKNVVFNAALVSVIIFSIVAVISYFFKDQLIQYLDDESTIYYLIIFSVFIYAFEKIIAGHERGIGAKINFALLQYLLIPLFALIIIFFLPIFIERNIPIWSYTIALVLSLLFGLFLIKNITKDKSRTPINLFKSVQESSPFVLISSLLFISAWTDQLMLKYYTDSAEVGLYSSAMRVAQIIAIPLSAINAVAAPKFSKFFHNQEMEALENAAQQSTGLIVLSTLPIVLFLICFPSFVLGLFGEEYKSVAGVLRILMIGQLFNVFCGAVGYLLSMSKYQKLVSITLIIATVSNIVINAILIPKIGMKGAAWASTVTTIFLNLSWFYFVKKKLGFYTIDKKSILNAIRKIK